ncbi:hypothetical protein CHUAL_006624 [Chamberlinius hualienensis]
MKKQFNTQAAVLIVDRLVNQTRLTPEELFEEVLSVDEEIYTNTTFVGLARVFPNDQDFFDKLSEVSFRRLLGTEKMILSLSKIGCLSEKIHQVSLKRQIRLTLIHMKRIMGWATLVSKFVKRKDFIFIEMLIDQIAHEEEFRYTPFCFRRIISLKMTDGSMFMDNVAAAVLSNAQNENYIQFINNLGWAENSIHVPPLYKMRESLRQMEADIKNMDLVLRKIAKVPTHPRDNFIHVMKTFIAKSKTDIKMLFRTANILEKEFEHLYDIFSISAKKMPIGEFFDEAVALAHAFKASVERVEVYQQ